jgi:hypothetical protein
MNLLPDNWLMFDCPCGSESIPLPHQNPLERYEDQPYQSTGYWPVAFLCRRRGRVYAGYAEEIELRPERKPYLDWGRRRLWEIEVQCAHENCGTKRPIYAKHQELDNEDLVIDLLLNADDADPVPVCATHVGRRLQKGLMKVKLLHF